jgi:2-amino-4-hydroxy-6-hydroxymethyldihydropteridine diphosphokinase/dihydropteroate synthase
MIYISIGTNLGDRLGYVHRALELLKSKCFNSLQCSIILETDAIVLPGSPTEWDKPYLNAIAYGQSDLSPKELLVALKAIEVEIGRPQIYEKWAPRIIDLDILLYRDIILDRDNLTIPHPQLCNRQFLLHMMAMISPSSKHPLTQKTFAEMSDGRPCFIRSLALYPKLVGIVNITHDSFSDGGLYLHTEAAIAQTIKLASQGATFVELGAQSTRPGATMLSPSAEYSRLKPVLDGLRDYLDDEIIKISIDSFSPEVIRKVIDEYPIKIINDVSGMLDDCTLKAIAQKGCNLVVMHSLAIPPHKDCIIAYDADPVAVLNLWAKSLREKLSNLGLKPQSVIIDPGIGFGKSIYHNIQLIRQLAQLKPQGFKVLVGHSRKSFIGAFSTYGAEDRDLETIAISHYLHELNVDYIRVHNVEAHQRAFAAKQAISGGLNI